MENPKLDELNDENQIKDFTLNLTSGKKKKSYKLWDCRKNRI